MKTTVYQSDFIDAFKLGSRADNFSYKGLRALFDYLEQYEADTGEEIELDVVAICCDYSEMTPENIAREYRIDIDTDEGADDLADQVREHLEYNTLFVGEGETDEGEVTFIFANF